MEFVRKFGVSLAWDLQRMQTGYSRRSNRDGLYVVHCTIMNRNHAKQSMSNCLIFTW